MSIFSTPDQLAEIKFNITNYLRLPFSGATVPGAVMEQILSLVRRGKVLNTYDFVDVVSDELKCGWQVKATKAATPVTWKRAKIPTADKLIAASRSSDEARQLLGNAIIEFCNEHARASLVQYGLSEIGFARLIIHDDNTLTYFERELCSEEKRELFNPADFNWSWSQPKKTKKKEQLPAFRGTYRKSGEKWWAWHGLGENQLHFSGERAWWPKKDYPHMISFEVPESSSRIALDKLLEFLALTEPRS